MVKDLNHWRRQQGLLLLLFLLFFLLASAGSSGADPKPDVQYCSPTKPLSTKYFSPFFESHRGIAEGCASNARTSEGLLLHVVSISTSAKNVLLTVTESEEDVKGVVLVLHSASPIGWRLAFVGDRRPTFRVVVALSKGSSVLTSNLEVSSEVALDGLGVASTSDALLSLAKRHWGGVSTFSSVTGANRISILLPPPASLPAQCQLGPSNAEDDTSDDEDDGAVNAYFVSMQPVFGCFYKEMSGSSSSDVHIVDLASADGLAEDDALDPAPVYLTLAPEQADRGGGGGEKRNITLVLRSGRPVKWMLQSSSLEGTLLVISDKKSFVHNLSLAPTQKLELRARDLKPGFEAIWRLTLEETGVVPVSYVKLDKGNIISIVIPPSSDGDFSRRPLADKHAPEVTKNDLAKKRVLIPGGLVDQAISREAEAEEIAALEKRVGAALAKKCSPGETVVAVDRRVTDKYSVAQITLNDPTCIAEKNATHWVLKSPSTSCGSLNMFSGKSPMFRNNVVLQFLPASRFFRKTVQIPFSCRFKSGLPGQVEDEEAGPHDVDDNTLDSLDDEEEGEDMYLVRVQRKRPGQRPQLLVERREETANVSPGDELRVLTDFETRSFLNLAIERCWISSGEDADSSSSSSGRRELVAEGCPASSNVTVYPTPNPSFSFTLTEDHLAMKKIYLFCLIGLCSPDALLASGNLGMCVDPTKSCFSSTTTRWHQESVAQQLTRRGPLFLHPFLQPHVEGEEEEDDVGGGISGGEADKAEDGRDVNYTARESPGLHSSHVVMVGVPAEIAVAIALASFVIGAGLTGMLCCIHHRKAIPKTVTTRSAAGGDGSELQAMMPNSNGCLHNNNGHAGSTTNC